MGSRIPANAGSWSAASLPFRTRCWLSTRFVAHQVSSCNGNTLRRRLLPTINCRPLTGSQRRLGGKGREIDGCIATPIIGVKFAKFAPAIRNTTPGVQMGRDSGLPSARFRVGARQAEPRRFRFTRSKSRPSSVVAGGRGARGCRAARIIAESGRKSKNKTGTVGGVLAVSKVEREVRFQLSLE